MARPIETLKYGVRENKGDIESRRAYHRARYAVLKGKINRQNYESRQKNIAAYKAYKATLQCEICGFNDPRALQFHHLRDKVESIPVMVNRGCGWEKVLKEIEKCQVLCANCHFILHAEE